MPGANNILCHILKICSEGRSYVKCSYHKKKNNVILMKQEEETFGGDGYARGLDEGLGFRDTSSSPNALS